MTLSDVFVIAMKLFILSFSLAGFASAQFNSDPHGVWPVFGIRSDHTGHAEDFPFCSWPINPSQDAKLVWSSNVDAAPIYAQIVNDVDGAMQVTNRPKVNNAQTSGFPSQSQR